MPVAFPVAITTALNQSLTMACAQSGNSIQRKRDVPTSLLPEYTGNPRPHAGNQLLPPVAPEPLFQP